MCLKLTIKTPERRYWRCFGVFNVNFEHILHLVLVSTVNFKHVIADWEKHFIRLTEGLRKCSSKQVFLKISQVLLENTWVGVSF